LVVLEGRGERRELSSVSDHPRIVKRAYALAKEPSKSFETNNVYVFVEERGGKLEEGEGESGGLCERRLIAESEDVSFDFDGEGRKSGHAELIRSWEV